LHTVGRSVDFAKQNHVYALFFRIKTARYHSFGRINYDLIIEMGRLAQILWPHVKDIKI